MVKLSEITSDQTFKERAMRPDDATLNSDAWIC